MAGTHGTSPAQALAHLITTATAGDFGVHLRHGDDHVEVWDTANGTMTRADELGDGTWRLRAWALPTVGEPDLVLLALTLLAANRPAPGREVTVAAPPADAHPPELPVYLMMVGLGVEARTERDYRHLRDRIPGLQLTSVDLEAPASAVGLLDSYPAFFKYRYGHASLKVGGDGSLDDQALWSASLVVSDDPTSMTLPAGKFETVLVDLVRRLVRAPFGYRFPELNTAGQIVYRSSEDGPEPEWWLGWGHTAVEAAEQLRERLEERQDAQVTFSPVPLNRDDRRFPPSDPLFTVRV